jgi:hypothetical protein
VQKESSFFGDSNRCSEIIMCYLFSKLRKRGVITDMKKIIMICAVLVSFLGLAHGSAHEPDSNLPDDFPEFIITQNGETAPGRRKKIAWHLKDRDFNEADTFHAGNGYMADDWQAQRVHLYQRTSGKRPTLFQSPA